MQINAYIADGTYLRLSNGVEFKIPFKLVHILMDKGVKVKYKHRKE